MIGYICPICEKLNPGMPAIYPFEGEIFFYCPHCEESWQNSNDSLRFGIYELEDHEKH